MTEYYLKSSLSKTYVSSLRSTLGGGYGSATANNIVGPEGGRLLAETTVERIQELWT